MYSKNTSYNIFYKKCMKISLLLLIAFALLQTVYAAPFAILTHNDWILLFRKSKK